jgi:hypothetical protein
MSFFFEGKFVKPVIRHDHGFLDDGKGNIDLKKKRHPTPEDIWEFAKWAAKLEAAETVYWKLEDATKAYRHFLYGNGAQKKFDYDEYMDEDESGKVFLKNLLNAAKKDSVGISQSKLTKPGSTSQATAFEMFTKPIGVGSKVSLLGPYPKTENWQKAIGAHFVYGYAKVNAKIPAKDSTVQYQINLHMYAEDMYNFNPGAQDITTHTPDSANGRFEECGLAKEFLHTSEFKRKYEFDVDYSEIGMPLFATYKNEVIQNVGRD